MKFHLPLLPLVVFGFVSCGEKKSETPGAADAGTAAVKESRLPREAIEPDAKVELREAYETALATADPAERGKALEAIAWDGIDVDPELAREAFAELEPGSAGALRLVGHFAMRLADHDPGQALEWARGLGQEDERTEAIGRIAVVISDADPERGATLIADEMPAGRPRDLAVVQVIQRWSRHAPADAATWILDFPQGAARGAGIRTVAAAWLEADPAALASWIAAREGVVRDEVLFSVAKSMAPLDDKARRARLDSLGDGEIRARLEKLLAQSAR